jgi:hypothetical protein
VENSNPERQQKESVSLNIKFDRKAEWEKILKIYVAGPYSASSDVEIQNNVNKAIDVGLVLWKKGHYPYIPHLTHFVDVRAKENGVPMKWEDYIEWDRVWLETCDALLFLGGSNGAKLELEYARKMGKTIFFSVNSVPTAVRQKDSVLVEQ